MTCKMKLSVSKLSVLVVLCICVVLGKNLPTLEKEKLCHTSADCEENSCCRTIDGDILTLSGVFDHVGPILAEGNGTCVPLLAQYDEHCGEFCPCDQSKGLKCYRTVSDNNFAPSFCKEKDFVIKWTNDFLKCWHDPKCTLPL